MDSKRPNRADRWRVPVISLWQPWATLLVLGKKQNETRSKPLPTGIRNRWVAIHATQRTPGWAWKKAWENNVICQDLATWGIDRNTATGTPGSLPACAIVGLVFFRDDLTTEAQMALWRQHMVGTVWNYHDQREFLLGDYDPGRYVWRTSDRVSLNDYPVRNVAGRQGIWYLDRALLRSFDRSLDRAGTGRTAADFFAEPVAVLTG